MVSEKFQNQDTICNYCLKHEKVSFFLFLTALGRGWDLVFAGSFCRLLLYESATAFSCFLNNKFQESLYSYY